MEDVSQLPRLVRRETNAKKVKSSRKGTQKDLVELCLTSRRRVRPSISRLFLLSALRKKTKNSHHEGSSSSSRLPSSSRFSSPSDVRRQRHRRKRSPRPTCRHHAPIITLFLFRSTDGSCHEQREKEADAQKKASQRQSPYLALPTTAKHSRRAGRSGESEKQGRKTKTSLQHLHHATPSDR